MGNNQLPLTILHCPRCGNYRKGIADTRLGLFCDSCDKAEYFSAELDDDLGFTSELAEALTIHGLVISFAERIIRSGNEVFGAGAQHPLPLAGGALFSMSTDALVLHQAVGSLCATGWAATAALQLRAELEILLNSSVIWNAGESMEYMAFKYSHSFLVETWRDTSNTADLRSTVKGQIEDGISRLPSAFQEKANAFAFRDRLQKYWYKPEFNGPGDVISAYGAAGIDYVYRQLSSPAHGGFLGFRFFRDDPDSVHPEPRRDPSSKARTMNISSMLCLDQFHLRAFVDGLSIEARYRAIRDAISHYATIPTS